MNRQSVAKELVRLAREIVSKQDFATYNGRVYVLKYMGRTKYGERALLQFRDGSREFWVDAKKVQRTDDSPGSSSSGGVCSECGKRFHRLTPCRDSSGILGVCCPMCARMSQWERSFA
jgi:hypothetical protein